ncbi:hypothetical protein PG991_008376 [Apiospora marii]|uniref:Uncharacterized protein n=1 Tax=Apiospora marii TaxID=335849 RepID=A0ABR1RKK6_9PEZI
MSQRRLSKDSCTLSHRPTSLSSPTDGSQVSLMSQSQELLESPTGDKPAYVFDVDGVESSGLRAAASRQPRPFWHRVGARGLLVASIGSLLLIGSALFLCYIWREASEARNSEGGGPSLAWQYIVFRGWITRAVTITATVMRSVVAAQATMITAMVAAIIIESIGVRPFHLPFMSMARTATQSPVTLATSISTSFRVSPGTIHVPLILLVAACLLTLGSQLTSTILLSDFGDANIAKPAELTNHLVSARTPTTLEEPWKSPPQAFWRFAEHRETNKDDQQKLPHLADTGRTLRAALPWIDKRSRVNLRSYEGVAGVWDARFVCHSPKLTNASFLVESATSGAEGPASKYEDRFIRAQGSVVYDEPESPLPQEEQLGPDFYNCSIPWIETYSICKFPSSSRLKSLVYEASENHTGSSDADGYILFSLESSDGLRDLRNGSRLNFTQEQSGTDWSSRRDGPWTRILSPYGERVLSLSHCVNDGNLWNLNVTMNGTSTESEPALGWTPSKDWSEEFPDGNVDTLEIRKQLGAISQTLSPQARGILSLRLANPNADDKAALDPNGRINSQTTLIAWEGYQGGLNFIHRQLFNDVLNSTSDPSLAMQAIFTVFHQMRYFDTSYMWQPRSVASYVIAEDVSIPVTNRGLIFVVAMALAHVVVLGITLFLFFRRTEATMIGNAWQSVAQAVSDDTLPILDQAGDMRDKEVKKALAESSEGAEMTGVIRRRRQNGKFEYGEK